MNKIYKFVWVSFSHGHQFFTQVWAWQFKMQAENAVQVLICTSQSLFSELGNVMEPGVVTGCLF